MRKVIGLLVLAVWAGSASAATINAGETFVFEFDSLPYRSDRNGESSKLILYLSYSDENRFGPSQSMRVSYYEDSPEDEPFRVDNPVANSTRELSHYGEQTFSFNYWQDLQGVFAVDMPEGSVEIASVAARVVKNWTDVEYYQQSFDISQAPNPAAALLFGSAFFGLGVMMRRKA